MDFFFFFNTIESIRIYTKQNQPPESLQTAGKLCSICYYFCLLLLRKMSYNFSIIHIFEFPIRYAQFAFRITKRR